VLKKKKEIRNHSIVAHGFGGISRNDIEDIIQSTKNFKKEHFQKTDNIFFRLEKELLKQL
jgi:hypothetical protein